MANSFKIYIYDTSDPKKKRLAYKIDKANKTINFHPDPKYDPFILNTIEIHGFSHLPVEFSRLGYIKSGFMYYFNKMLLNKNISQVIISKDNKNSFRKYKNGSRVVLNYDSFQEIRSKLASIKYEAGTEKSNYVDDYFYRIFPSKFKKPTVSNKRLVSKFINSLDKNIIPFMEKADIAKTIEFFEVLLKKKKESFHIRSELVSSVKLKVDKVAITDIIEEFEKLLDKNPPEHDWGIFLRRYLFLVDSRYIKSIPNLNVVLSSSRKVDFGLIDSQDYLDIFEIKKPTNTIIV